MLLQIQPFKMRFSTNVLDVLLNVLGVLHNVLGIAQCTGCVAQLPRYVANVPGALHNILGVLRNVLGAWCNDLGVLNGLSVLHITECRWSIGSMGYIGGAGRTFACKSQECLWQDWYI